MLDCLGTLDRPQLSCIASLLQREIYLTSGLPITETGFPTIQLSPANFLEDIIVESLAEELPISLFLVEDHAALVLEKDKRLCHLSYSESMSPDSGSDSDEDADSEKNHRISTFLLWINKKSTSPGFTREMLNDTRDIIIRCIRNALPKTPETDDILDHMLAGAYIRQMMVVQSPDQGPNAQTAVFCVETFEDFPQTLVFKFLAGSDQQFSGPVGPMNFPTHSQSMIAIERTQLKWLSEPAAMKVAKPSAKKILPTKDDTDEKEADTTETNAEDVNTKETNVDDAEKEVAKQANSTWDQSPSIDIPSIHFKSVAVSNISSVGYGGVQVIQVKEKRNYCDEVYHNFCVNFCGRKRSEDANDDSQTQTKSKGSCFKSKTTQPNLTKPLVR
eukprot:m.260014 g.260014  ORF g.260014 m.260014 type:complete len:388 (+) comp39055_c0_seq1:428-1591(+)